MESIQQHLCITGVCLMTLLEKAAVKWHTENCINTGFCKLFFFFSFFALPLPIIFVCWVEIKMAF